MHDAAERRLKPRIIVGPEYTIQFLVKGHAFHNVRITNLSVDGCFATVQRHETGLFAQGTILEQLNFEHPDLAKGPITATVSYALGEQAGKEAMPFIGLGIHFLAVAPETSAALIAFVDQHQPR